MPVGSAVYPHVLQNEYIGIPQSALNGTEMEIRVRCGDDADVNFTIQFVLRSSPCDKEFFDVRRLSAVKDLLVGRLEGGQRRGGRLRS